LQQPGADVYAASLTATMARRALQGTCGPSAAARAGRPRFRKTKMGQVTSGARCGAVGPVALLSRGVASAAGPVVAAPGGSLAPNLAQSGVVLTSFGYPAAANAVALQPDGRIVAAGAACGSFALARYQGR